MNGDQNAAADPKVGPPPGPVLSEVRPTYAPAIVASGAMLILWGTQTYWLVSLAGLLVLARGLQRWVDEIRIAWILEPTDESKERS